jgi:hypothetical protein
VLNQQKLDRLKRHNLTAELATDGSSGSGNEHHLIQNVFRQKNKVRHNWLTTEKIVDV